MNCPYCGKEMEQGYIVSSSRRGMLLWSEDRCNSGPFLYKSDLKLAGTFQDNPPACLCRDCRKIVMEY